MKISRAPQNAPAVLVSVIVSNIGSLPFALSLGRVSIRFPYRRARCSFRDQSPFGPKLRKNHMTHRIAFQGEPGAYSHQACRETYPGMEPLPCRTFEDAIAAVREGRADLAMLPVENSTFGRVADIHHLLPESGLHIVGEAFVRVHINLLA